MTTPANPVSSLADAVGRYETMRDTMRAEGLKLAEEERVRHGRRGPQNEGTANGVSSQ